MPVRSDAPFPQTRPSIIQGASSDDAPVRERATADIARVYWAPVYTYLRLRWRFDVDDASDVTQEFFARALTRDLFRQYQPEKARFRTYVRLCLDSYVANAHKAERRVKRGGGAPHVALAAAEAVVASASSSDDPDVLFEREWMRALLEDAMHRFRDACQATGKTVHFAVFHRYDVESAETDARPTYTDLADAFDLPVTQVTNYLAWARRHFRLCVLDALRAHCGSDEEFQQEARRVFGVSAV